MSLTPQSVGDPVLVGGTPDLYSDVTPADGTTAATAVAYRPGGGTQPLTVTVGPAASGDPNSRTLKATGWAPDVAGEWVVVWTITGTGHDTVAPTYSVIAVPTPGTTPTLDPTTDVGLVRLLIPDTDPASLLFTDAQITALLTLEGTVKRAVAQALETVASNEAMVSKVIRTQDLSTDGAKVAAELRARAAGLRAQDDAGAADTDSVFGFQVVDFDPYPVTEWATGG